MEPALIYSSPCLLVFLSSQKVDLFSLGERYSIIRDGREPCLSQHRPVGSHASLTAVDHQFVLVVAMEGKLGSKSRAASGNRTVS